MKLRPLAHRVAAAVANEERAEIVPDLDPLHAAAEDPGVSPTIQDLPTEVLIEIMDYLTVVERQKIRSACQKWNQIVFQLFETPVYLTTDNAKWFANSQARFIQAIIAKTIEKRGQDLLRGSPFFTQIQKLELRDVWLTIPGFRILQHTVAVQELVLTHAFQIENYRSEHRNLNLANSQAEAINENGQLESWLPALTTLRIHPISREYYDIFLRLITLALRGSRLTTLEITVSDDQEAIFDLMSDFIQERRIIGPNLAPGLETYGLIWKIMNWNRNSLINLRLCSQSQTDRYRRKIGYDEHSAVYEIGLDRNQVPRNGEICGIQRYSCCLSPLYLDILDEDRVGNDHVWDVDEWARFNSTVSLRETLQALNNLEELKLVFDDKEVYQKEIIGGLETLTVQIILRNAATLRSITLQFQPEYLFKDGAYIKNDFIGAFADCVSLKTLEVTVLSVYHHREDRNRMDFPKFRGIEKLPNSLKHLSTSLPIVSDQSSISKLECPNLANLETLCLSSRVWFILRGALLVTLDLVHIQQLKAKLPKLRKIVLDITSEWPEHDPAEDLSEEDEESDDKEENPWVSPELLERFKNRLEFVKWKGTLLTVNINQL